MYHYNNEFAAATQASLSHAGEAGKDARSLTMQLAPQRCQILTLQNESDIIQEIRLRRRFPSPGHDTNAKQADTVMIYILFAICAGITVTLQNSINGLMAPVVGAIGASFLSFSTQAVLIFAYLTIVRRRLPSIRSARFPEALSGPFAMVVVGLIGVCVSRMGSAVTTCCSVAGQIIISAVIDHFGLFNAQIMRFRPKRTPGFLLILTGVLSINLIGASDSARAPLLMLMLSILLGGCAVIVRTLNVKISDSVGSAIDGAFVNSFGGSVSGLILFIVIAGFRPDFSAYLTVPAYYYTAGIFGLVCLLLNIYAYKKLDTFYATIFMLIGQIATGILIDLLFFRSLSFGKCVGILLIILGIALDKIVTRRRSAA